MAWENVADHHNALHPHCADRVLVRNHSEWFVFRLDDPFEVAVELIPTGKFCFHLFECGAA